MHSITKQQTIKSHVPTSISDYFPEGTQYFYSYPTGEDSNFLNKVPPTTDELVAARTLSCAGPDVSVVSFASTAAPQLNGDLIDMLAIPQVAPKLLTVLPKSIDIHLRGKARNEAIMAALAESVAPGSLVMAQPFTDKKIQDLYQISPDVTVWLNDKVNMIEYIDAALMPTRFGTYTSGSDFAADSAIASRSDLLPCVVKVSSSSAGDGVYICHSIDDFKKAQSDTASLIGTIYVEQFITPVKNYAIHFGISHDKAKPIDIIGYNEQLTTNDGEFLGGIISGDAFPSELAAVKQHLENDILPIVRAKGWYGVGGFDVIIDARGGAYLIDGNYRMTGMSAYHFLLASGDIQTPLISFGGQFVGTREEFEHAILPFAGKSARQKSVQLIALSKHGDEWDFNGALMYENENTLKNSIHQLLNAGITSPALEQFL
ncbi:MAG: hypothetical protein JWN75_1068 [Candidatus Saccharibacteria bacterium]|nr:hypothetical protein [Candidatus Saccharibacteria bacterium]